MRQHQFLAATQSVGYTFERMRGISNMLFGGSGFFIDKFHSHRADGLWLHGYGNVFEKVLAAGEAIDIEPGGTSDASAEPAPARSKGMGNAENPIMHRLAKLLILTGFGLVLTGCVVAPYGPRPHAYVAVPAPVVVVHPYHRYYWY